MFSPFHGLLKCSDFYLLYFILSSVFLWCKLNVICFEVTLHTYLSDKPKIMTFRCTDWISSSNNLSLCHEYEQVV